MSKKQQFPRHDLYIPSSRLVRGSLTEKQTEDFQKRERETPVYWFAVACSKNQPGAQEALGVIYNCGVTDYANAPQNVKGEIALWLGANKFAWRVFDGDTHPKWKDREGCAGSWIFSLSTTFDIRCANAQNQQIDPAELYLGCYIDVAANVCINGLTDHTAGVFINPEGVRFLGHGEKIIVGKSIDEMFANRPAVTPAGALPAPTAPGTPVTPGALPAPAAPPAPATAPAFQGGVTPPPTLPPAGSPAAVPAVPAGATPVIPAPGIPAPGVPTTASPSSVPSHPGILTPPAAPPAPPAAAPLTAAQVAAQYGVQHYPGHRYDPAANAYVPDPTSV